MYYAIKTKYQGPKNSNGSRVSARFMDTKTARSLGVCQVSISYDPSMSSERNHGAAAYSLLKKYSANATFLLTGGAPYGDSALIYLATRVYK